ncbi:ABC-2 type transport system permease protein [Alkalibacillus filiformis]|uniref:ABC-2 type transport system permease protein n=1 Tax=Alkalibacillus filiformis TaxID=200990 RepID=A0ABU0DSQ2_9BACI|nr:ABC transporter permease [Alkalibacillus filiformis]MDQ0351447.1 ABC-2 type transport system permease protein [Alkalibacillus filiformis]
MRNSIKVGKWEIKRNIKNKSFIISLFLTPLIFLFFATVPNLLSGNDYDTTTTVYVNDQLGTFEMIEPIIEENNMMNWDLTETNEELPAVQERFEEEPNSAYIQIDEHTAENGVVTYVKGDDVSPQFSNQLRIIEQPLKQNQLQSANLTEEQLELISTPILFEAADGNDESKASQEETATAEIGMVDPFESGIPAAFAGLVLFSIVITGMMIFQSASQEKKDKVAEIILSSVTPGELMQGKILGYFVLGLIQVGVWMLFAIPIAIYMLDDVPVLQYLFVPETFILVIIAILGYLLFAALFVGLGATLEDASSGSNFQGMVMMLPFIPVVIIGPVLSDPSGIVAQVGSYIPFTSPTILILRLAILDEWPWIEILIGIAILLVSIWLFMKLAGKIFKVGILIYGKNATPQEIWKWLRA